MDMYPLLQGKPRWGEERAEWLLDLSLQVANTPGRELVRAQPPSLPQVDVWRSRMGYPLKAQRQVTIGDIIDVNRIYNDPRINWTGTPAGYSGSSRNSSETMR
jgi:hypothetical protein